jgi:hypothetical protein
VCLALVKRLVKMGLVAKSWAGVHRLVQDADKNGALAFVHGAAHARANSGEYE